MSGFLSGIEGLLKALGVNAPPPQSLASQVKPPAMAAPAPQANPAGASSPPASATGAAPPPAPQGFGEKVTNFLENPLLQGALGAYLGTIGSPRQGGWGRAIASGGITGLNAFNQAEHEKTMKPYEQAQIAEAQARVPVMQSQAEAMKRELTPISGDLLAKLDSYKAAATNKQEAGFYDLLESYGKQGLLSPKELVSAIEHFDEQKRLMEMMKGQSAAQMAAYMPFFMQQMGMPAPTAGATPPGMMPFASPPAGAAPPASEATAGTETSSVPPGTVYPLTVAGKEVQGVTDTDGKTYYLDGGKWTPIP